MISAPHKNGTHRKNGATTQRKRKRKLVRNPAKATVTADQCAGAVRHVQVKDATGREWTQEYRDVPPVRTAQQIVEDRKRFTARMGHVPNEALYVERQDREEIDRERQKREYRAALPFEIHVGERIPLNEYDPNELKENYCGFSKAFWDDRPAHVWELADAILNKGLSVSFRVPRSHAAWLAAHIAQCVTCTVIVEYDFEVNRLIVQQVKGDDVE